MTSGDIIKCTIELKKKIYYRDDFAIAIANIKEVKSGAPQSFDITIKGTMVEPHPGDEYYLTAKEINDLRYGLQYEIISMASIINIDTTDKFGQKKFLLSIFTESQVQEMYAALDEPFQALSNEDVKSLVQIKGCGLVTATKWIDKFNRHLPISKMYIELEQYNLTTNMLEKLYKNYGSAEMAIQKVTTNPYVLCEVEGIGWAKADMIAQAGGMGEYHIERVKAFILYYLGQQANNGYSFVSPDELMGAIIETIGDGVPDLVVSEAMNDLPDELWWNKEKTRIGLKRYRILEENIAKELLRIRDAESQFDYGDWEKDIEALEAKNGWKHTEQQIEGIRAVLQNNIVCINGVAGVGKTSVAEAMLQVLKEYSSALCALSGRAAARIAQITGDEGYTILRLLGFPSSEPDAKQGYFYHNENPLPYDIIIVDEISMIGGYLFYYLLRAVKNGAKVVLLGDIGQLESIGECNVAADIIKSPEIPTITLDKIHRQAKKSAIITESIKMRHGEQIISKDWAGEETRGELHDFTLDCYSDKSNTYYKILQHFMKAIQLQPNILEVQIISPVKKRGESSTYNLNNAVQELYNPANAKKNEIKIMSSKTDGYILREGDKVLNTKNYRKLCNPDTYEIIPIFNGNIGIIKSIDPISRTMVVYFSGVGTVLVTAEHLRAIELGYAITCHKCQGSQFDRIIFAIDYSTPPNLLSREMLYTGVTRAKKHCTLIAQNSALRYAVCNEKVSKKETHLVDILHELAHPVLDI